LIINPRLKALEKLNLEFCYGANELRWEVDNGVWSKKNFRGWGIDNVGWARSIKYKEKNKYMFVMDLDGNGIDTSILLNTYKLYNATYELLGVYPLMKASGKSGTHIILPMKFPGTWGENRILQTMKNIAFTIYNTAKLTNVNIGRAETRPFVDMHMYERGRLVRGLSIHMGSRKFAVPINYGDTINIVNRRMLLLEDIPDYTFDAYEYKDINLDTYDDKLEFEKTSMELMSLTPSQISSLKWSKKGDRWYRLLPPQLKVICNMDIDVKHMLKVHLVSYLSYYYAMDPEEIHKWLTANVKWEDYNPNSRETMYNIRYTHNWIKGVIAEDEFDGVEERVPIPGTFWEPPIEYDNVWKEIL